MEEEEGPAFISFSGLPEEDVDEFVLSVESLRKHFKWSGQVAYCYARTMIKGTARKLLLSKASTEGASGAQQKGKLAGEEVVGPSSWNNLRATLLFEYSENFAEDRLLRDLLSIRQQTGETVSEYAQRFIDAVSSLVVAHSLDTHLLAVLFAQGLRSEKAKMRVLMRRPNSVDKAIGFVAPDQMYKVAKLVPLLSPPLSSSSEVGHPRIGQVSPGNYMRDGSLAGKMGDLAIGTAGKKCSVNFGGLDEDDENISDDEHSSLSCTFTIPTLKYDMDGVEVNAQVSGHGSGSTLAWESTANGATFSLDDNDAEYAESDGQLQAQAGYLASTASSIRVMQSGRNSSGGYRSVPSANAQWTPPAPASAHHPQLHRQNISSYALTNHARASSVVMAPTEQSWAPAQNRYTTLPRSASSASAAQARQGPSLLRTFDLTNIDDDVEEGRTNSLRSSTTLSTYPPSAGDRAPSASSNPAHLGSGGESEEQQVKSAADLNSLADQLEHLSSMLRVQSDARRRRPRLCYRCRQKGHMAAECPLPLDVVVPNQQQREQMGLTPTTPPPPPPMPHMEVRKPLSRSNTVSSTTGHTPRRVSHNSAGYSSGGRGVGHGVRRRNTQSWNWGNQNTNPK